ncbi:hypothetical protein [Enterovibrio baiacu]|uniref:hypothetical protein n=1 Tax=Enterovibrio baiacu TaxID=2491023 RepID=UPI0010120DB3|nr:hypothetical protein [Enterovibrio baiacu]MBE1273696.1 hypothetical protein [Enterovibrio baiacu]
MKAQNRNDKTNFFTETVYVVLALLTVANGLSYNLILWVNGESNDPFPAVLIVSLFTIMCLHRKRGKDKHKPYNVIVPCLVLSLACLIPSTLVAWVGLACASVWRIYFCQRAKPQQLLWLMIAGSFIWKSCLFKITSSPILDAETWLIGSTLSLLYDGLIINGNHLLFAGNHDLSIGIGCSCFSNVSFVMLGWVSLFFLKGGQSIRPLWPITIIVLLMSLNIVRIGIMAISYDIYLVVHEGVGLEVYNVLLTLIAASALLFSDKKTPINAVREA